jgi:hypothetical protein
MPLYDIPKLLETFADLKKIYQGTLDGKAVTIKSSDVYQQGEKLFVNCDFEAAGASHSVKAQHYLITDQPDEIEIDGMAVDQDDVDLTKVLKLMHVEIKYTLEYSQNDVGHVIILRAKHNWL